MTTQTTNPTKKETRGGYRENGGRPLKSATPTRPVNLSLDEETLAALALISKNRSEAVRIAALAYVVNLHSEPNNTQEDLYFSLSTNAAK